MKITAIELFHLALPLCNTPQDADPRSANLETVLVRVEGDGAAGWGEAAPGTGPTACGQWAAGAFACLADWLAPAVVGKAVDSGDELQKCLGKFSENQFAKAALDAAWWDLQARLRGVTLAAALGGSRDAVEVGTCFDRMDSPDEFLAAIGRAFEQGYARVKLMFRPGWDLQMLNAVRAQYPTQTIHVDVEGAMRLEHMETLCRIDDFGVEMVEQPLAHYDFVGHAMVQETLRTPVCLGESIRSPQHADIALELQACRYVNIMPGRVGGLTPALAIHDACREANVACWVGSRPQTAVGVRTALSLAAKNNFTYPADFFSSGDLFGKDLAEPLAIIPAANDKKPAEESAEKPAGKIKLWTTPGIGIDPDMSVIEKFCINRQQLGTPK